MTNYSFLSVTKGEGFHFFNLHEIASYHAYLEWITGNPKVKVALKSGNPHIFYFTTLEEAKASIKIIGDIRLM